jgi:acyl-CoA reductase-like NAD-dependent aldehyde dehydrogenase
VIERFAAVREQTASADAARSEDPALLIGGRWVRSADGGVRECVNPADGTVVAVVDEATPADAARAVAAARAAFDSGPWPTTPSTERLAALHRIADLLALDKESLARIETDDTGSRRTQLVRKAQTFFCGLRSGGRTPSSSSCWASPAPSWA